MTSTSLRPSWQLLLPCCWLLLAGSARVAAQAPDSLRPSIERRFTRYAAHTPIEKLFAHLDRPCYVSGETMWLKLSVVEGTTQRPLPTSTVAYVEVLDPAQTPVLQAKIPLRHATGQGSLVLPAELASGRYTVRAYTRWMQNFGPAYYFHTTVAVVNTRQPLGAPVAPVRPATSYDPQFFPEGGYLVQGLVSRVGFKLTAPTGRGASADVTVLDATGAIVAHFTTLWAGMGSFSFTPTQAGAAYRAVVKLANQSPITCALPAVRTRGYVMRLEEADPTQLRVVVQTRGLPPEKLFLLGHARQQIVASAEATVVGGQAVFLVPKQSLAAGVSHFTLFDSQRQPVCERLYFRPPTNPLIISAQPDKNRFTARQKVTLRLAADGALPANLSVAVYQLDSLSTESGPDITSYLWLAADLKGPIEHASRYFELSPEAATAADNLMLTQGWSRFRWARVLGGQPDSLPHPPEQNGPLVRGRVVHRLTGAPKAGIPVYLSSPSRRIQLYQAISQADGGVQFELPDLYGTRQLIAQPDPQRDSLCQVELFSPFAAQYAAYRTAPLSLTERLTKSLVSRHVQAEVQQRYFGSEPPRYLAPPLDSAAFYGQPSEQYLLDKYTRFKVMEEVMREYVPGVLVRSRKDGFHFLVPDNNHHEMMENPLILLDGLPIFQTNRIMAFDPLKVEKLDVLTNRYFLGSSVFTGIVSYATYKGDLGGFAVDPHALLQTYEGLQGERTFYAPRYETPAAAQSRLPDFRNLLYWNPEVIVRPGAPTEVSFYTSDQLGPYRVEVQGLNGAGQTGSAHGLIEVKEAL